MRAWLYKHAQEAVLAGLLLVLFTLISILDPRFLSLQVQSTLAPQAWELALVAFPMTLVVLSAGIDLSVGAVMSLAAVALGLALERGVGTGVAVGFAVAVSGIAGTLNGLLVTRLQVHPLIVTLATMAAFFGIAEGVSVGRPISGFPPDLATAFGGAVPGGLVLVAFTLYFALQTRTVAGVAAQVTGANETAARYSGYAVDRLKVVLYALTAVSAGLAAVMYAARRNTVTAEIGRGFELDVITAVVLGGTAVTGGRGTVVGTALGVLVVHETRQFVSWHWERDELNLIVIGGLLIVCVLVHRLTTARTRSK